jgi:hypothetical protein
MLLDLLRHFWKRLSACMSLIIPERQKRARTGLGLRAVAICAPSQQQAVSNSLLRRALITEEQIDVGLRTSAVSKLTEGEIFHHDVTGSSGGWGLKFCAERAPCPL